MKIALVYLMAVGLSTSALGTWAERVPAEPIALPDHVCSGSTAPLGASNAARLEEYLSFHAQATAGRGLTSVMPWHVPAAASN